MMKPIYRRLLWSLYILIVAVFFAYRLFPSEAVGKYIEIRVNQFRPEFRVVMSGANLRFPLGIGFKSVQLNHQGEALLDAENFRIGVGILSAFTGRLPFSAQVFGGRISGIIGLGKDGPTIDGLLSGLQISEVPALERFVRHKLVGQVDGTFIYQGGGPDKGKAKAALKAEDAAISFMPSVFDLERISFRSLEADLNLNGSRLDIARCELKGDDLDAEFSGMISLKKPIGNSLIRVSGNLRPHPVFLSKIRQVLPVQLLSNKRAGENGIPIRFYNTLEAPRLSFR